MRTIQRNRSKLLALPLMALAVIAAVLLGQGAALAGEVEPEPEVVQFNVSGEFDVNQLQDPCVVTGTLDAVLGEVIPQGQLEPDAQTHTLSGTITVDCGLATPSVFQVDGTGNCKEKPGGQIGFVMEVPVNCGNALSLVGTCESLNEPCKSLDDFDFTCDVQDATSFTCVLSNAEVISSNASSATFDVKSGIIALSVSGVGGIVTDLDADEAATPLESADSSGSAGLLVGIVVGISAAVVAVIGGAWYTRRRLVS